MSSPKSGIGRGIYLKVEGDYGRFNLRRRATACLRIFRSFSFAIANRYRRPMGYIDRCVLYSG